MSRSIVFHSARFPQGYASGGPVDAVFNIGEGERGEILRRAIRMSVATLLDREKVETIVLDTLRLPLKPHTSFVPWPRHVQATYQANRHADGEPQTCCPTDDELQQALQDEINTDPTGKKYRTRGKPDPDRIVKLLQERTCIPNLLPCETISRAETYDDLADALKNEKVARLAAVGWITRAEALRIAGISLSGPDPTYQPEVPGPSRLSLLFDAAVVEIDTERLTRIVSDIVNAEVPTQS